MIGKNHKGGLVTLAERKSRYVLAGHIRSKHAEGVTAVTTPLLGPHKDKCRTITFDNGKEFAEHEKMAAKLKVDIYFAHPYHSWERGLNENNNGLLRQYFPKGMELIDVTEEQVQEAVERINHRPRKEPLMRYSSGWKYVTPSSHSLLHFELESACHKNALHY